MTNDALGEMILDMNNSINEVKASIIKIESEIKHIVNDKLKNMEEQIDHQKELIGKCFDRIETLEQAPAQEALKAKQSRNDVITKGVIGTLVTIIVGIIFAWVVTQIKQQAIIENKTSQVKEIRLNEVAVLPKDPHDPLKDGEYCETEESK